MASISKKKTTAKKTAKKAVSRKAASKKAASKKTASKKAVARKKVTGKKVATADKSYTEKVKTATKSPAPDSSSIEITAEERWRMIAVAAYHKAEKRGFSPGNELHDWAEAEKEIDKQLYG